MGKGVKNMSAMAMSWSQVCKQLSGMGGMVDLGDVKVRPLELMQKLGVHVLKNSYKPADIFTAWSRRLMNGEIVQISRNCPVVISLYGEEKRLCTLKDGKYVGISQAMLCNLVSATDKRKDSNDVVVNCQNVLRGLMQSVYVDHTVKKLAESAAKVAAITEGYVNMAAKGKADNYVKVVRNGEVWTVAVEPEVIVKVEKK